MHEKLAIAGKISSLGYNTPKLGGKFLAMISGDTHMLTYDDGVRNEQGHFPIFQCSTLDSSPSCKGGGYGGDIYLNRGGYCHFRVKKHSEKKNRSKRNIS